MNKQEPKSRVRASDAKPDSAANTPAASDKWDPGFSFPKFLTVSPSPHIKNPEKTSTIMLDVLIALIPAFAWGVYVFGFRALLIGVLSVGCCVGFEAACQFILRRPVTVSDLSACVTGLLLAMNLPVGVPLFIPVVGSFFAIVIVKQLFGGIGKNFVNPALAARVFLFSWAGELSTFTTPGSVVNSLLPTLDPADLVVGATPLASLKEELAPGASVMDMFLGNVGGCIGEVSALLLLAGGIWLLFRRIITWHTPVAFIGTVAILSLLFPRLSGQPLESMLYEVFSGGLFLAAIFMATDYATTPVTPRGRIIFGVGCGALTYLIRRFGSYAEGVSFSILIMNLLVWYIDKITMPRRFGGGKHGN